MGITPFSIPAKGTKGYPILMALIRCIHVTMYVDRLQLACIVGCTYGVASRFVSLMKNEGYLEGIFFQLRSQDKKTKTVQERRVHEKKHIEKNPLLVALNKRGKTATIWPYQHGTTTSQEMLQKTEKWDELMLRINHFLEEGEDTWQVRSHRTESSSPKRRTRKTKPSSAQRGRTGKGGSRSSSAQALSSVTVTVKTTTSASTRSKRGKVK